MLTATLESNMNAKPPVLALRDEQRIKLSDDTLWRKLDGEAVVLQLSAGVYYGVNEVGAEALTVIRDTTTFAELIDKLLNSFEVDEATLRRDMNELLADMLHRSLIEIG